ncbi:TetR/AcrR family transcriptional regulator [Calidithermus chliarophilus]|uniref:TetR/AcrR family transcriptional regulator n=1 Tax=Calidithermus chliarophilus TaxID=52023 RepID=UPI000401667C|nr:TetR/AcrR family transcriptional regulator [Calidithermus chliarophilus]
MVSKLRARKQQDKEARREQILAGALELSQQVGFAEFTMTALAARLGLAKGTLYLYFQTKEELFLTLYERLLGEWFDALEAELNAEGAWDSIRMAWVLRQTLESRPQLTRLLVLVEGILEHNISLERARQYKGWLAQRVQQAGALIERRLAYLSAGEGTRALVFTQALVAGLHQMSHPAPVVAQVLAQPEFAALRVEFGPALERALEALLRGLKPRLSRSAEIG